MNWASTDDRIRRTSVHHSPGGPRYGRDHRDENDGSFHPKRSRTNDYRPDNHKSGQYWENSGQSKHVKSYRGVNRGTQKHSSGRYSYSDRDRNHNRPFKKSDQIGGSVGQEPVRGNQSHGDKSLKNPLWEEKRHQETEESAPQGKINVYMLEDPMYNYMQEKYKREKEERIKQLQALLDSSSDSDHSQGSHSDSSSSSTRRKNSSHRKRTRRHKDEREPRKKRLKRKDSKEKIKEVKKGELHSTSPERTKKKEPKEIKSCKGSRKHKSKKKRKHKHS